MRALEILSSPAHALSARNRLEAVLAKNAMPPLTGIQNQETLRSLIDLARDFKELGDKALQFEGEELRDALDRPTITEPYPL